MDNHLAVIVKNAASGDSGAFRAIVLRFQDMAVGYAFSILGDFHLAEDAAQEAFIEANRDLSQLREFGAFPSWFRQLIFKQCDRLTRRKRHETVPIEQAFEIVSQESDPHRLAEEREMADMIYRSIESLSERQRQAVTLFYISDYSQKEVAAFLNVPVTTVQKRLSDARKALKERMFEMFQEKIQKNAPSKDNTFVRRLENAIQDSDIEKLKKLIQEDPGVVNRECEWFARKYNNHPLAYAVNFGKIEVMEVLLDAGADVNVDTPYGNPMGRAIGRGNTAAMDLLHAHGAQFDPNASLMLACEAQRPEAIKWLLDKGADPNFHHEGWDCSVLMSLVQTYNRRESLTECVNLLIDAGAEYEDGPIMDILRGLPDLLRKKIVEQPALVNTYFDFDYGDHLTLRGSTLMHIAVEYNIQPCVDVLLMNGADLDAQTRIGNNGVGGQTPIFHAIGSNQGRCYDMFEYLLGKQPDLKIKARIQENPKDDGKIMDCMYKGKDHSFDEVRELTPLGYALRYANEPQWRNATKEVEKLRETGAPEA